jgi:hypothetical protein
LELAADLELRQGRTYRAVLIRPGLWEGKGLRCSADALRAAAGKFEGAASFLNPPGRQWGDHGYPMLERMLAVCCNASWSEECQAVVADYRLTESPVADMFARLVDGWLSDRAAGRAVPAVGLSAVLWLHAGERDDEGLRDVLEIVAVDRVDAVYRPAAGGEFLDVVKNAMEGVGMGGEESAVAMQPRTAGRAVEEAPAAASRAALDAQALPGVVAEERAPAGLTQLASALRGDLLQSRLALSGLPERWRRVVAEGLPETWTVEELDRTIQRIKAAWAEEEQARTVQGVRPIVSGMLDGYDQINEALCALIEGRAPSNGVRPLSGLREAYLLLSGDYEMTGVFRPDRVQLANVSSTTMVNIVANAMNKIVVSEFRKYPRWWEPIVRREHFSSLQQIRWITLNGISEIPTVSEGGAYTEMKWSDAAETADWVKKGAYIALTVEAMDKDDVGKLRMVPAAMAEAAWKTLAADISGVFLASSGVGPTMSDGKALFHADRGNLGATALSSASWAAAKLAMRKQTDPGSGQRVGGLAAPRYLIVPPDLENTALTVLASEGLPGTANNDVNPEAEGNSHDARLANARRRIIVVDSWTDTNDWAAVADPGMFPTIGLGFRYGDTPELFSVASPNSGLMFSNDSMPIKLRWFYAVGPMDSRGLYKANVAG